MRLLLKILCMSMLLSANAHAVTCYITMVKASCWKDYDLTVNITDAENGKELGEITVYEGDLWKREKFDCKAAETLALVAKFSPTLWEDDADKEYKATRFWKLPKEPGKDAIGWNVTVCYPEWFADVPTPPKSSGDCACDMSAVPKFKVEEQ